MVKFKTVQLYIFFLFCFLLNSFAARSQITPYSIQGFNFGTFYRGNAGGTISISTEGSRTAIGDIILMNTWLASSQAIFEIEAPVGTTISVLNGTDGVLTGSNGGSVTLHLESSDLGSLFTTTAVAPARTRLKLSGKLIIGNRTVSPPGIYQGTFIVTFNQE